MNSAVTEKAKRDLAKIAKAKSQKHEKIRTRVRITRIMKEDHHLALQNSATVINRIVGLNVECGATDCNAGAHFRLSSLMF